MIRTPTSPHAAAPELGRLGRLGQISCNLSMEYASSIDLSQIGPNVPNIPGHCQSSEGAPGVVRGQSPPNNRC